MAKVIQPEPQSASDYDDRTTSAVKAVLVEMGQVLGSFKGKFAIIGGAVPWLLLDNEDMRHVGTVDVDIGLDAEALGDGEYVTLIEALMEQGYKQQKDLRKFQLVRQVDPKDGGEPVNVVVDFLMPREAKIKKNKPPLLEDFAVIKADGADLALEHFKLVKIKGPMPGGGTNTVEIAVASVPALLAMKGHAVLRRDKNKDSYDIYYCIRNYVGGPKALAKDCKPLLTFPSAKTGYAGIVEKFSELDGFGPISVRKFVEETAILGGRTPEQWQQDAFGQVKAWSTALLSKNASKQKKTGTKAERPAKKKMMKKKPTKKKRRLRRTSPKPS